MGFLERIEGRALALQGHVVLAEGDDERIIAAAEGIAVSRKLPKATWRELGVCFRLFVSPRLTDRRTDVDFRPG